MDTGYSQTLETVGRLAQEMLQLDAELEALSRSVEEKAKKREEISSQRLPELLDELGYSDLRLSDGRRLEMKSTVRASIPTESGIARTKDVFKQREMHQRRLNALAWLREHDLGDLIKNEIAVQFSRGQEDEAADLYNELEAKGLNASQDSTVNSQTLSAQVKELLAQGEDVPLEVLGVQIVRSVVVK